MLTIMNRVRPERWLLGVLMVAFASVCWLLTTRFASSTEQSLVWLALWGGVGLLAAAWLVTWLGIHDFRLSVVNQRNPGAAVFQAYSNPRIESQFERLHWITRTIDVGAFVTLSFDGEGMSVWSGVRPRELGHAPWAKISSVSVGDLGAVGRGRVSSHPLVVSIELDNISTDLRFALERVALVAADQYASEREVTFAAIRINEIRTGKEQQRMDVAHAAQTLSPGTSAHGARQLARWFSVARVVAGVAAAGLCVYLFGLGLSALGYVAIVGLLAPTTICSVVADSRAKRAIEREGVGGYTTLNDSQFQLPQVHPRSGRVLREANATPLSKAQFALALQQ